ncbi:Acyl transferase/acyl hydrolase/lysophospholipase [Gracilaria domingensis]|nr:Acyl transferase/acyl hydrolase/lysophospholipase [Gracilaria domingensis]
MVVANATTPSYKLGLCLAGAATGGAYSAGVLDFLLEAVNEWEALKNAGDPTVPPWDVNLREVIGTSAGGITATLAIACLNIPHEPLPRGYKLGDPPPKNNPLFQTWVKEMNADRLLSLDDLDAVDKDGKAHVRSVLNAEFMSTTAPKMIAQRDVSNSMPAYARGLCLSLTTTNMRGVPYSLTTFNSINPSEAFYMRQHADYCQYVVTTDPSSISEKVKSSKHVLDISQGYFGFSCWLCTVRIKTPRSHYENRMDMPPCWKNHLEMIRGGQSEQSAGEPDDYTYCAVDGGTVNNEPFGLLEKFLTEGEGKCLQTNGKDSWGSIILIDPFPSVWDDPSLTQDGMSLLPMLSALISSIREQAMFKREEIEKAVDDSCMAKFMIRPHREVKEGEAHSIATATMGSFGGILDEKIRLHDFQLGRANCKDFLEKVFCISRDEALENSFFNRYPEFLIEERIPIIPIVGKAAEPLPIPEWPSYTVSEREQLVADLLKKFNKRIERVVRILLLNFGIIKPTRFYQIQQKIMNIAGRFVHSRLVDEAMARIETGITTAMKVFRKPS